MRWAKNENNPNGNYTDEEIALLYNNIKRGIIAIEKERLDLEELELNLEQKYINNQYHNYILNKETQSEEKIKEKKEKFLKIINEAKDFKIESYDDGYEYGSSTLVTYDLVPESDEIYHARILHEGRSLLRSIKAKIAYRLKNETRKVIFEKINKKLKKRGRPIKEEINVQNNNELNPCPLALAHEIIVQEYFQMLNPF